ncbi:MAG: biopolymer transporter ExbD [bacterium]
MARTRRLNGFRAGELNLTAMIDVAFQLLAFFILTAHPVDVMANLDVNRPMTDVEKGVDPPAIRVTVFPGGYTVNGVTPMTLESMAEKLGRIARLDKSQTIVVQCVDDSAHGQLVDFLDVCARLGMTNLAVVSSNGN